MGAVRTSRRDKWDRSPAVSRYYAWRDELRLRLGISLDTRWQDCQEVHITAVFGTHQYAVWGKPYLEKPDADNIWKAVTDACLAEDCGVHTLSCKKLWGPEDCLDLLFVGLLR